MAEVKDILARYKGKLEKSLEFENSAKSDFTQEYKQFKKDAFRPLNTYEKVAKFSSSIIQVKPSSKDVSKFEKALSSVHSNLTPVDAASLAVNSFLLAVLISIGVFVTYYLLTGQFLFMYLILAISFSVFLYHWLYSFPMIEAKKWQLKASSQLIQALLYIVIYMKHTPNLERAIKFTSENLEPPLSLDFKKIFWDVEVGKYSSVRASIDAYLESWRDTSLEFVEAMHLIESSLYEPAEYKRVAILEKGLKVMLEGVQEKMLDYTHEIKSPLTNIYMLGIVLPTLALALLPLASALLGGLLAWQHVIIIFNVIVPFFVYYLTSQVLLTRPAGYGESSLLEMHPDYKTYISPAPGAIAFIVALPLFILGMLPFLMLFPEISTAIGMEDFNLPFLGPFFDMKQTDTGLAGPFGVGSTLLSLLLPLSIALYFAISYGMRTSKLIETRRKTRKLENEYSSALFQLGNRLAAGVPAEMSFGKVAEILGKTPTGNFFSIVNTNIQNGMSVKAAIFNRKRGAITYFPSALIKTSMLILIEGVKKGLKIAAESVMSIAEHAKNIHKIEERLKDLVADVVISMKSNISFLAPILGGIVMGLAAMITLIINQLTTTLTNIGTGDTAGLAGGAGGIVSLFNIEAMIPPYFLQIAIGIYLIQVILILTGTIVVIENGVDKLTEKNEISKNLFKGVSLYLIVSLISILTLSLLASIVMGQIGTIS